MRSKKSASAKRANLPRDFDLTKQFEKDWKRLNTSGRFDMPLLKKVMLALIANDEPLEPERRDHALQGEWHDFRECHIHGDFLLIYKVEADCIVFARAGTHADLFE